VPGELSGGPVQCHRSSRPDVVRGGGHQEFNRPGFDHEASLLVEIRDQGEWHVEVDLGGLTRLEPKSKEADELFCRPGETRGPCRCIKLYNLVAHETAGVGHFDADADRLFVRADLVFWSGRVGVRECRVSQPVPEWEQGRGRHVEVVQVGVGLALAVSAPVVLAGVEGKLAGVARDGILLVAEVGSSTYSCKVVIRHAATDERVRSGPASHPDGASEARALVGRHPAPAAAASQLVKAATDGDDAASVFRRTS